MKVLALTLVCITLVVAPIRSKPSLVGAITVDPDTSHQTFRGWDATAQTGKFDFADYALYKDDLADKVVAAGINSFRMHCNPRVERPDVLTGPPVNDNADPFSINMAGFQWQRHDQVDDMADFISLVKTRYAAIGETVYVATNYAGPDEVTIHSSNPEEYAELIEAEFIHLRDAYGWVPDAVEVINEPDFFGTVWSPTMIANTILATKSRIAALDLTSIGKPPGWYPGFFAPSTMLPYNAAQWYSDVKTASATAAGYITEISFHWYGRVPTSGEWTTLKNLAIAEGKTLAELEASETISAGADMVWDYKFVHMLLQNNLSRIQQYVVGYDWDDSNGAYFTIDHTTHVVGYSSRLKLAQNYFRWIRPGAVRKATGTSDSNFDAVAFRNVGGNYTVVVNCLTGGSFTVTGVPAGTYHKNWATASSYNQADSDQTIGAGGTLTGSIGAAGVYTFYADAPVTPTQTNKMTGTVSVKGNVVIK